MFVFCCFFVMYTAEIPQFTEQGELEAGQVSGASVGLEGVGELDSMGNE